MAQNRQLFPREYKFDSSKEKKDKSDNVLKIPIP